MAVCFGISMNVQVNYIVILLYIFVLKSKLLLISSIHSVLVLLGLFVLDDINSSVKSPLVIFNPWLTLYRIAQMKVSARL